MRLNNNTFDYIDGIAHSKHNIGDRVRYIWKGTNNLDETIVTGIDEDSYREYAMG